MELTIIILFFLIMIMFAFFPSNGSLILLFGFSLFLLGFIIKGLRNRNFSLNGFKSSYTMMLTFWLLWNIISIIWVRDLYAWLVSTSILFISYVFSITLSYLYKIKFFRILLRLSIIFLLITHQSLAWLEWTLGLFRFGLTFTFQNPMWFFSNINDFALLQLFTVFNVLRCRPEWNPSFMSKKVNKLLKALIIFSSLYLILLATSRGIFAAALFGLLVYGILSIRNQSLQKKMWIGFLVIIIAVSIFLIPTIANDPSIIIRNNLVLNGFEHLKMTNFLGVGAGNISYYLENFIFVTPTNGFTVMHNWFMGILVTNGLVFFLIYASYYLYAFMKSFKIAFTTQDYRAKFLVSWLAAFFIASVIPNSLFHIMWFWFIHHFTFILFEDLNNCDIESKV